MKDKTPAHTLTVDSILYSTWGYEQTNADNVVIQKLETIRAESSPLAMSGTAVPGNPEGEQFTKRVVKYWRCITNGNDDCIRLSSFESAKLWDGRPVSVSWYG